MSVEYCHDCDTFTDTDVEEHECCSCADSINLKEKKNET